MDRPHDDVRVPLPAVIDVIKPASVRQAVMVEKGGVRVDTVRPHPPIPTVERLHQPKGVCFVLGEERGGEFEREPGRRRREDRGEKGVQGGGVDVRGSGAMYGEEAKEVGGGSDG